MTYQDILNKSRGTWASLAHRALQAAMQRPLGAGAVLLGGGLMLGLGTGYAANHGLRDQVAQQQVQIDSAQADAQREINALAARLGELQAEANRLNALGKRLTRIGQLQDGEFDFNEPVGMGGVGPVEDMPKGELDQGLSELGEQFRASGEQLSVLESLLFNRQLDMNAVPSREPIESYITSNFGHRADPFRGGRAFHKGIDFKANVGDPVMAVADGVVSFSGVRSGYGNTIEIDHGNGYVTRYAHNSRLSLKVGGLVRAGEEVAKAGSSGRSTGAHVHFEVWQNGQAVNPKKFLNQQSPLHG
ncbi:M23 family metallopeptidase [Novilysobacter avium]|uniref:Peptidoglycan DD-metalloendopeptidase family protein n=2 Tax=Lysobacteraceae TaxID=32033 RepID=A0A7S6ZUR9_9GAMM|nr:peptidoglycan DD-metalloendopeptidase family protein [Lysobacter avium]QOW24040.1 peptidoglycan DD-metalloendopeptidase family protein [Lysobacter sp. H23M47]